MRSLCRLDVRMQAKHLATGKHFLHCRLWGYYCHCCYQFLKQGLGIPAGRGLCGMSLDVLWFCVLPLPTPQSLGLLWSQRSPLLRLQDTEAQVAVGSLSRARLPVTCRLVVWVHQQWGRKKLGMGRITRWAASESPRCISQPCAASDGCWRGRLYIDPLGLLCHCFRARKSSPCALPWDPLNVRKQVMIWTQQMEKIQK